MSVCRRLAQFTYIIISQLNVVSTNVTHYIWPNRENQYSWGQGSVGLIKSGGWPWNLFQSATKGLQYIVIGASIGADRFPPTARQNWHTGRVIPWKWLVVYLSDCFLWIIQLAYFFVQTIGAILPHMLWHPMVVLLSRVSGLNLEGPQDFVWSRWSLSWRDPFQHGDT